jgi:hypothetical protein
VRLTGYAPDAIENRLGFIFGGTLTADGAVQRETGRMNRMAMTGDLASRCSR